MVKIKEYDETGPCIHCCRNDRARQLVANTIMCIKPCTDKFFRLKRERLDLRHLSAKDFTQTHINKVITESKRKARNRRQRKNRNIKQSISYSTRGSAVSENSKYQRKNNPCTVYKPDGSVETIYYRRNLTDAVRVEVFNRDGLCCQYCGFLSNEKANFEIDHVYPVSLGGKNTLDNLKVACLDCNHKKGNKLDWSPSKERLKEVTRLNSKFLASSSQTYS